MITRIINQKSNTAKGLLVVLILLIMGLAASSLSVVKASSTISLSTRQGAAGATVSVSGAGFSGSTYITFDGNVVASAVPDQYSSIMTTFTVPNEAPGTYNVTGYDNSGNNDTSTVAFTIVAAASPTPSASVAATPTPKSTSLVTPTPAGASTGTTPASTPAYTYYPTYTYAPVSQNSSFWSPLVIGIIVAVLVVIMVPVAFLFRGRGDKQRISLEREEPMPYRSDSSSPTSSYPPTPPPSSFRYPPTSTPRSSSFSPQLSKPSTITRPSQASTYGSSYGQKPLSGKTCPHCGQTIRADYSVCPFCYKRIK